MVKSMLLRLFGFLLMSQLCGCAGTLSEGEFVIHASARPATFDITQFRYQATAVLPAVTSTAQQGYAPELALALDRAIKHSSQAIRYIPPHVTISLLNQYDLAESYSQTINNYRNAGILNKAALQQMGKALNADYVFVPVLAGFSQQIDSRVSQLITLIRTHSTQVNLALQLWNTHSGELIWQASGQATLANETIGAAPVAFVDVAHGLWSGILEDFFEGRTNSRYSPIGASVDLH